MERIIVEISSDYNDCLLLTSRKYRLGLYTFNLWGADEDILCKIG